MYKTIDEWIKNEAVSFSFEKNKSLHGTFDRAIKLLNEGAEMIGFGEALHGGEEILILRNRLFKWLVKNYDFRVIALESGFPEGMQVNDYVTGEQPVSYQEIQDTGFSHGFGQLEANRKLIEWIKKYNRERKPDQQLHVYGFDIPDAMSGSEGLKNLLEVVLKETKPPEDNKDRNYGERIESLFEERLHWDNPMVWRNPETSAELRAAITDLRIEVENIHSYLGTVKPRLIDDKGQEQYKKIIHYLEQARQMINFYLAMTDEGYGPSLAVRDRAMANNLEYILKRERSHGRVFVFAQNAHLQKEKVIVHPEWQQALDSEKFSWWPAGAHLARTLGNRYAAIGSSVGVSEENGIKRPENGTLEACLSDLPGDGQFIKIPSQNLLPADAITEIPVRSGSRKNLTYRPLTRTVFDNFDGLLHLDTITYNRGGPPLPNQEVTPEDDS